eukprot:symbB.v1.2.014432.t1/scaffold1054.1/size141114/4
MASLQHNPPWWAFFSTQAVHRGCQDQHPFVALPALPNSTGWAKRGGSEGQSHEGNDVEALQSGVQVLESSTRCTSAALLSKDWK